MLVEYGRGGMMGKLFMVRRSSPHGWVHTANYPTLQIAIDQIKNRNLNPLFHYQVVDEKGNILWKEGRRDDGK